MGIYAKLAAIQQHLVAPKNQYNSFGDYKYRSCEDILEGLKPCLQEVNAAVTLSDELVIIGERYYIQATATLFCCESGEKVSNTAYARETESRPKMDVSQITGSASSYARKYALNGLFCIDDSKDIDTSNSGQEQTEELTQEELEKAKIPEVKQKALSKRCSDEKVDEGKLTNLYKVKSFAELSEKQFRNINDHWEDVKKVCS